MENNAPSNSEPDRRSEESQRPSGDDLELQQLLKDHTEMEARHAAQQPGPRPFRDIVTRAVSQMPPGAVRPSDEEFAARQRHREQVARQRETAERLRQLVNARGERYAECSLQNYRAESPEQKAAVDLLVDFCEQMSGLIRKQGQGGLILYGPRGTGKDHLLMAAMRYAIEHVSFSVRWCNGMDLIGDIRDRIQTGEQESALVRSMTTPDILAISDPLPPFGVLTEFQATMLFRIIDARYSRRKPIWVTVNVANRAEFEQRMGAQLVDRLIDGALVMFCNWASFRQVRKKP